MKESQLRKIMKIHYRRNREDGHIGDLDDKQIEKLLDYQLFALSYHSHELFSEVVRFYRIDKILEWLNEIIDNKGS